MELVRAHGLPEPERQVKISDEQGFIGVVDFCWPLARHVVEVDSTWHDGPLDRIQDAERDVRLRAAGYTIARYRYAALALDSARVVRELAVASREYGG
jgi:very-short-patch-repair endonuclease